MNKRRDFIKRSALGIGALTILPSNVIFSRSEQRSPEGELIRKARPLPSDKIYMACCGIGNRGGGIMNDFANTGLVEFVALCDTDMGAAHTVKNIEKYPGLPRFNDFREMFDKMKDSFDALSVGTPDFSHFPISMLAMSEKKHIYVEKPLARTFNEVELMMDAAKRHAVVTQMGNQGHSEANYFQFKTWVEKGIIKDVTDIVTHMNGRRRWHGWNTRMINFPPAQPLPETLDWDTWLGTAQFHDYHKDFVNGQWRCWYDFGMGALGDWGAHIMDTFHEFLDLGLPEEVDPLLIKGENPLFFPQASTLKFKFPARDTLPPVTVTWYDGQDNIPAVPAGYGLSELDPDIPPPSDGKIQPSSLNPGKIIYTKDLIFKGGSHGSTLKIIPEEREKEMASLLPDYPDSPSNHFENFLLACMGKEKARSSFEIAGPLSQVFNLGVIAQMTTIKIRFDRKRKKITNSKLANSLLSGEPPRKGWEEFYKL